ncbi:unnamed protein product [Gongylonema pulchrum]|uniref:Homeobox domain-containing protein n=1 Tax=Gongylonema pulchrum TaxID=637853 RepID=A0A183DMF4_9BILA|nr:unnamed protein product [Gongylonema pulchrum]
MPGELERSIQNSSVTEVGPLDVLDSSLPPFPTLSPSQAQCANPSGALSNSESTKRTSKDMGEFFNSGETVGPIERYFQNLRLTELQELTVERKGLLFTN